LKLVEYQLFTINYDYNAFSLLAKIIQGGILDRLTENIELYTFEVFPLLAAVWLHDIGMFVGKEKGEFYEITRKHHHLRSVEFIKKEFKVGRLPLDKWHLPNVLDITRAHEYGKVLRMHGKFNEALIEFANALRIESDYIPDELIKDEIAMVKKENKS
jgi:hypothetical protein